MVQPTERALRFSSGELVRICIPAGQLNSREPGEAPEIELTGRVARAMDDVLSIVLDDAAIAYSGLLPCCAYFTICKITPLGIIEFDATGHPQWFDERLTLQVELLGTHHRIQRRESFRIELRSEVRYRSLEENARPDWKTAELYDVSLGGASLLLQDDSPRIGHKLMIEFALFNVSFSASSVIRRIQVRKDSRERLCAVEYLDLDQKQQNCMARAMFRLQTIVIHSRVNTN